MRTALFIMIPLLLVSDNVVADTKLVSACSSTLSDNAPPVLEPLRRDIGNDFAHLFVGILGHSALSKFLLSTAGSSCLANMNGTALGQVLSSSTSYSVCAVALEMLNIPLVQYALGNLTVYHSTNSNTMDVFIDSLRLVDEAQVEHICSLYVDGFVPCLRSQLLPSLTTLRSTSAHGCCAAWETESVSLYGYTITGLYTKIAQLFGDVFCATQTPAFNGLSSQRCGFTFLQSSGEVANTTFDDRAGALLESLRVPTSQACLEAEGEAYYDTDGNVIKAVSQEQYTASGCVVALDRLATWMSGLPLADSRSSSYDVDLQSLFGADKCINGATVFSLIQDMLPSSIVDVVRTRFSNACLHVPIIYADGCNFSRPASLVNWNYEPQRAKQVTSNDDSDNSSLIHSLSPNGTDLSAAVSHGWATTAITLTSAAVLMSIV